MFFGQARWWAYVYTYLVVWSKSIKVFEYGQIPPHWRRALWTATCACQHYYLSVPKTALTTDWSIKMEPLHKGGTASPINTPNQTEGTTMVKPPRRSWSWAIHTGSSSNSWIKRKMSFIAPGRSCEMISYLNAGIYDGTKGEGRTPCLFGIVSHSYIKVFFCETNRARWGIGMLYRLSRNVIYLAMCHEKNSRNMHLA